MKSLNLHGGLVSTARGLGKQAEDAENQRLSLEIVDFGVARGRIDALGGLRQPRQTADLAAVAIEPAATARR